VYFLLHARNKGFQENVSRDDVVRSMIRDPQEDMVIAVRDGTPVAVANIQTYTMTLSQIGSVFTLEEERGKGYCKAVVSEICNRIVARNKRPSLFVRKNNTPAVYE